MFSVFKIESQRQKYAENMQKILQNIAAQVHYEQIFLRV